VRAFMQGLRFVAILHAAITAVLVVWATPIVDLLFGSEYAESANVLRALGPYIYLVGFGAIASVGAMYLGEARRRIPVAIAALVVNVGLDVILIPRIGVVGGAIGTSAAYALYGPGHVLIVRQTLGFSLRPLGWCVARSLAAGAAAGAVLAAFGTSELSLADWVAGGSLSLVAFVGVLLLTGEVSAGDVRRAARVAHRVRRLPR
jgi:O-antigen/teichoic acid export membrane protein